MIDDNSSRVEVKTNGSYDYNPYLVDFSKKNVRHDTNLNPFSFVNLKTRTDWNSLAYITILQIKDVLFVFFSTIAWLLLQLVVHV